MCKKTKYNYKRFSYNDRLKIEALYNAHHSIKFIAETLDFHISSLYKEIKRGLYNHLDGNTWIFTTKYSADKAQQFANFNRATQGRQPKLQKDYAFIKFIETQILKEKKSPQSILLYMQQNNITFQTQICLSTLYNYIRKGMFLHITEKDLWRKGKRKKKVKREKPQRKTNLHCLSIENRNDAINARQDFGHWEIDSVLGKKEAGQSLITLTERKTRFELIFRTCGKTAKETERIIENLKKQYKEKFPEIFKTITCDNGAEFSTLYKQPFPVYYCHPYSSWERGSNENQNGFIRRFIPKGTRIETIKDSQLSYIQDFINNYPRPIFNGKTSQQLFDCELSKIFFQKN